MYPTEPIYVIILTPPSVFTSTTIHVVTCHSDPDQLLRVMSAEKPTTLELTRTSRIGMGSSRPLSHLTEIFIAEKKNSEAVIRHNPAFLSKNVETDDRVECHHSE